MLTYIKTAIFVLLFFFVMQTVGSSTSTFYTEPIVEKSVPSKYLSFKDLRAIFTLTNTRWSDGTHITVVILTDDSTVQRTFLWEYFGLSSARYAEMIKNKATADIAARKPIVAHSEIEALKIIASTKGAIGFLEKSFYSGGNKNVRVLKVR